MARLDLESDVETVRPPAEGWQANEAEPDQLCIDLGRTCGIDQQVDITAG